MTSPAAFQVETFKSFLREIRCPVVSVSGGTSGWQPEDAEQRLGAIGAPVERLVLEGGGHMLHWTRPREVAEAIDRFARTLT